MEFLIDFDTTCKISTSFFVLDMRDHRHQIIMHTAVGSRILRKESYIRLKINGVSPNFSTITITQNKFFKNMFLTVWIYSQQNLPVGNDLSWLNLLQILIYLYSYTYIPIPILLYLYYYTYITIPISILLFLSLYYYTYIPISILLYLYYYLYITIPILLYLYIYYYTYITEETFLKNSLEILRQILEDIEYWYNYQCGKVSTN